MDIALLLGISKKTEPKTLEEKGNAVVEKAAQLPPIQDNCFALHYLFDINVLGAVSNFVTGTVPDEPDFNDKNPLQPLARP